MIKSFKHDGLERFFRTGSKAGIQPAHEKKLRVLLTALDIAIAPANMNFAGTNLHALQGDLSGFWSLKVNGNWRIIFTLDGLDVILVDYCDYH